MGGISGSCIKYGYKQPKATFNLWQNCKPPEDNT